MRNVAQWFTVILAMTTSSAWAASGTPEEQAACRHDVRRFCDKLPANSDDSLYLQCLEINRSNLSAKCLAVLTDHGR